MDKEYQFGEGDNETESDRGKPREPLNEGRPENMAPKTETKLPKEHTAELLNEVREKLARKRDDKDVRDLVGSHRMSQIYPTKPIQISTKEAHLISETAAGTEEELKHNYQPGFGVVPSGRGEGPYASQVYARDLAQAGGNIFAKKNPAALIASLKTIFKYQKTDGMLPLRVEKSFQMTELWGPVRTIGRLIFKARGQEESPAYEGSDFGFSGSEDTVPATLVTVGELFLGSDEGHKFMEENYSKLEKATEFFRTKVDPKDGLAVITRKNADWADSIIRKGKLGGINVWWARGLRMMEFMSKQLGHEEQAKQYRAEFRTVKQSLMEKLYNSEEGFIRAEEGKDRVDTVASIFAALYILSPEEAVKVEETLAKRVKCNSGLRNFDPPYPQQQISEIHRLWGWVGKITQSNALGYNDYHNAFAWPWVTLENIQVKIKIALQHQDEAVRDKYKQEAIDDLVQMSRIFKQVGGYREILNPDDPTSSEIYGPPMSKNLMGTMAAYQGAYTQLQELGWIVEA